MSDIGLIASDFADNLPAYIVGTQIHFGVSTGNTGEDSVQYFVVNKPPEKTDPLHQRPNYRLGECIALMGENPVSAVIIRRDSECTHSFEFLETYKVRLEKMIDANAQGK